jgi:hypothetical protein
MLTTETDGNSIEGNNSCLMDGIIKAPNRSMAIVASATRLRFARLSLARKDMVYSSIHFKLKIVLAENLRSQCRVIYKLSFALS